MRRRFFNNARIRFDFNNYLSIEALEDGLCVQFHKDLEYGIDGLGWNYLEGGHISPRINTGQIISFRANLVPNPNIGLGTFIINKKAKLLGNCYSILFSDNASEITDISDMDGAFRSLFKDCTKIESVSLNFLPAITLSRYCYESMFLNCSGLIQAPTLPANVLSYKCYANMFYGCSNLNYIKALFTTEPTYSYTENWVSGVSPTGTFVKNKDATWNVTGSNGVPTGWTVITDDQESGGNNLISFIIVDTQYQAEEGMTWGEWVNSEYNIDNYQIGDDGYIYNYLRTGKVIYSGEYATPNSYIDRVEYSIDLDGGEGPS